MRLRTVVTLLLAPLFVAVPTVAQTTICMDGQCHEVSSDPGTLIPPQEDEEPAPAEEEASAEPDPSASEPEYGPATEADASPSQPVHAAKEPAIITWPAIHEYFPWLPDSAWPYVEMTLGAIFTGVLTTQAFFATGPSWAGKVGRRLAWLGFLPFLSLFSRIHSNKVLDQPVRRKLMNAIEADAGQDVDALATHVGVSWSTARHHLRHLESHNLVHSIRSGKKRIYFAAGTNESLSRKDVAALGGRARRRVARAVLETPGTTNAAIAQDLGIKPPSVSHHLHALMEAGFVVAEKLGRQQCLTPTARLTAVLRPEDAGQVVVPSHLRDRSRSGIIARGTLS